MISILTNQRKFTVHTKFIDPTLNVRGAIVRIITDHLFSNAAANGQSEIVANFKGFANTRNLPILRDHPHLSLLVPSPQSRAHTAPARSAAAKDPSNGLCHPKIMPNPPLDLVEHAQAATKQIANPASPRLSSM
jgi:hypothetical protein